MSSNNSDSSNRRGRGGRRGPRTSRGGRGAASTPSSGPARGPVDEVANLTKSAPDVNKTDTNADTDEGICWICAEPVKFYAVAECNHRTCHICALRLRALYKRKDCTFCKHPQVSIIFTSSAAKPYSEYTPNDIPFTDRKLEISFETEEMMEETLIILRFNCPDVDCDFVAQGWHDLKWHAKDKHDSILCDLCIRHKKIFAHEHTLYSHVTFSIHMPSAHSRRFSAQEKEKAGLPDFVHPMCQFCKECFFGDDELFGHLREHHEECFVCKREGVRDQYFQNYEQLEQHFKKQHFPCTHPACLEQKFVVFTTMLDLQGHQVEVHGEQMSSRDRRDARRVDTSFVFGMESGRGGRGGRGGYRGDSGARPHINEPRGPPNGGRAREPPPHAAIQPPPQPGPPPGSAPSAPTPRGGSRRAAFGASLTVDGANTSDGTSTPAASQQEVARPTPPRTPDPNVDPETAEQHAQFLSLLNLYASTNGVTAIRSAIRSFRASESSARDMVGMIHTVLDENMNTTSTIINALVPLFDEEKRKDILNAWNGMKIEQRDQFPSLTPTALGSGFADVASGRVLNVKHSTAPNRAGGSRAGSSRSSDAVWDRVERVAAGLGATPSPAPNAGARAPKPNVSAFPQLGSGARSTASSMSTPWSSGGAQASQHLIIAPARAPEPVRSGPAARAPAIASSSAFPDLPSSSNSRVVIPKLSGNQSLRRIAGETPAPANVWGAEGGNSGGNDGVGSDLNVGQQGGGGKGKKKKGKETLFTLGSFPS